MKPALDQIEILNDDAVLTTGEAARLLGLTRQGVQNRINRGQIKATQVGGQWYIKGADLKAQVVKKS